MRSELLTIIKKEFRRFFGDKRLFLSTVILPGLIIFVMYTLMGQLMSNFMATDKEYKPKVYAVNEPESAKQILKSLKITYHKTDITKVDGLKKKIENQKADVLMVFPDNFDEDVLAYDAIASGEKAPEIAIYYNSAAKESEALFRSITAAYDSYETTMSNKFDINADADVKFDLATEADTTAQVFSMLVPMLLIMMLMSGCMAVAPEAIAGEKERGTMATLLVTPVKRSNIALGKVISLSVFALMSGASSTLGVLLSLPKLMGGSEQNLSAAVYTVKDYVALSVTVLATVLTIISLFSIVSTFAKTVKEAGSYASPIMLVGTVVAVVSSMSGTDHALSLFTIPIYNSAMLFSGIFSMKYTMAQVGLTVGSNLIFMAVCVFIMTRMFNSEKIMFSR
ncbi:MAG: ABC transporter permease [Lachnospiraceae bacterium]|jgi:sodium transport system permease protein|nr:ABC transporter permease [Lachnospiraceae bacterium]